MTLLCVCGCSFIDLSHNNLTGQAPANVSSRGQSAMCGNAFDPQPVQCSTTSPTRTVTATVTSSPSPSPSSPIALTLPSDVDALLAIHSDTAGENWTHKWNVTMRNGSVYANSDPCRNDSTWFGVTCEVRQQLKGEAVSVVT